MNEAEIHRWITYQVSINIDKMWNQLENQWVTQISKKMDNIVLGRINSRAINQFHADLRSKT